MRIVSLVFSFLVTVSLAAMALTYVPDYVGQQRVHVQSGSDSSPDPQPYHSYGSQANTKQDTTQAAIKESDPYHQRYYSESEGWTYYRLPSKGY
jgi:hypothetical protein